MTAAFARLRVHIGVDEQATLLIEWRDNEPEPANYYFVSMAKLPASNKQLVRLVMQRWRVERTYQDLKGELELAPIPWTPGLCRQGASAPVGFGVVRASVVVGRVQTS
jgi:hypothetical protein